MQASKQTDETYLLVEGEPWRLIYFFSDDAIDGTDGVLTSMACSCSLADLFAGRRWFLHVDT